MSDTAPRGVRLVITLIGRRNAGKSSLINALAGQDIAIVSDHAGTTTDPVAKHYELLPLGPVTFYDTAGLDDSGELGEARIRATRKVLARTDIVLLVIAPEAESSTLEDASTGEKASDAWAVGFSAEEKRWAEELRQQGVPFIVVFNKTDIAPPHPDAVTYCHQLNVPYVAVCARPFVSDRSDRSDRLGRLDSHGMAQTPFESPAESFLTVSNSGVEQLKQAVIAHAPKELSQEPVLVSDLIGEGDTVLCVVPIDLAAPKGRLILPQVQVLRDVLDADAMGMVVKERELEAALDNLRIPPALVVTDSQVVLKVAGDVPDDVPLTTFSTLFARFKGDLATFVEGARALDTLKDGDRILLCEACSHHAVADDIGRVKIPRWIRQYTGKDLHFEMYAGHDFPESLEEYALAVHCGGCMSNRAEMLRRIRECTRRGVPITNYGVCISAVQGVLERVIAPFGL